MFYSIRKTVKVVYICVIVTFILCILSHISVILKHPPIEEEEVRTVGNNSMQLHYFPVSGQFAYRLPVSGADHANAIVAFNVLYAAQVCGLF